MGSIDTSEDQARRTYPLKKPPGHKAPVTRWTLHFPDTITYVHTLYVGVQCHSNNEEIRFKAENNVENLLTNNNKTLHPIDTFRVTDGFDIKDSRVWVAYYTTETDFQSALSRLNLVELWNSFGHSDKEHIGLWIEQFTAPLSRLETNYARLDHKPGLAQLSHTTQPEHDRTAYWGAGRDRIPASAHDLFSTPNDISGPVVKPRGIGERLTGTNYENMCHIRSGQWWTQCDNEEREAYETNLQETLMEGMRYLWSHPEETGTIGLRFLQNLNTDGEPIRETCGAGFHRNWSDLERWSSRHPSHLAIFNGMMRHARRFGETRKLMTWHEVWIFKEGECGFEYVNCGPQTGVLGWVELKREELDG